MLAAGDYLRSDYLGCLKQTRSPSLCDVSGEPQLIQVRKRAAGNHITVGNFHEGFAEFEQQSDGSVRPDRSEASAAQAVTVSVLDARRVRVEPGGYERSVYFFIGDLDRYVARMSLAGRYVDGKGRSYVFGSDGWASFPDRRFEYVVGSDHILDRYDYFFEKPGGRVFVFERSGGLLRISRTTGQTDEILDKRPSYSLRELSSAK